MTSVLPTSSEFIAYESSTFNFLKMDLLRVRGSLLLIFSPEGLLVMDNSLFALLGLSFFLIGEVGLVGGSVMLRSRRACHAGSELRGLGKELAACLAFFLDDVVEVRLVCLGDKFLTLELLRNFLLASFFVSSPGTTSSWVLDLCFSN